MAAGCRGWGVLGPLQLPQGWHRQRTPGRRQPTLRACHVRAINHTCSLPCPATHGRYRVACALKVLPYLTDASVVMVHDWEER